MSNSAAFFPTPKSPYLHLSTIVHGFMWISVYNLQINQLRGFCVHSWWINTSLYTQLIHTGVGFLTACNSTGQKKKLDQLSTYPQRLLQLLIIKISLF